MNYSELDLNLLKMFICVADCKTISKASQKLYISQPAVSNSIKKLENALGVELFVRVPKGVKLTSEGEMFYELCIKAMSTIDAGVNLISDYAKLQKGQIKIGSSSTIIRHMLIPFFDYFSQKYPDLNITIFDGLSTQLVKYLQRNEVDLSIVNSPVEDIEQFNVTEITDTQDCFIAGEKFSQFKNKTVSKDKLATLPLILQKKPSNNRDYFDEICEKNQLSITPRIEMASFGLITDFAANGMGIGFTIKDFVQKDIDSGRVFELKTDLKIKPRKIVVMTNTTGGNSFATKTFITELQNYFKK